MTLMPRLRERALHLLADLGVLERHDRGQVLEHRDLGAHVRVVAGELDAHGAGADDDEARRARRRSAGCRRWSRCARRRARGRAAILTRDPVARMVSLPSSTRSPVGWSSSSMRRDPDAWSRPRGDRAPDVVDLVLADEAQQALVEPLDDLVAARGDGRRVDGRLPDHDARTSSACWMRSQQVGRLEHRLGRDAADVEAGAADLVLRRRARP